MPTFLQPPPIPDWNSLHPIIVHLPIGLFLALPILLMFAMCFGRNNKGLAGACLVLMAIGVGGLFLATSTGEAAASISGATADAAAIMHEHEELAELTRNTLSIISGAYLLFLLFAAAMKDRLKPAGWFAAHLLILLALAPALLMLANAGHLGGRLVHQYNIKAIITGPPPTDDGAQTDKLDSIRPADSTPARP